VSPLEEFYDLLFEFSNENRHLILLLLKENALRITDIEKELGLTNPEIRRHISRLNEINLIERNVEGYYSLTPYGETSLKLLPELEFLSKNKEYFQTHVLNLPPSFLKQIGKLMKVRIISNPLDYVRQTQKLLKEVEGRVCLIVDQFPMNLLYDIVDAIDRRVDIRLIESKDREIDLSELTPEEDNVLVRIKTSPLYEQRKSEKIQLQLYITEYSCILCFPMRDDQYDYTGFLCDDDAALEWCNDLFNYYWKPITSSVSKKSLKKEIQKDDLLVEKKVTFEELDDSVLEIPLIQDSKDGRDEENIDGMLSEAAELEKKYKWLEVYELYDQALKTGMKDYFRKGEIQEKIGYSLYRAAFQNEQERDFLDGVKKAAEAYSLAQSLYEKMESDQALTLALRCKAFSKYLEHWTIADSSDKLDLLKECHKLKGEALDIFWDRKEFSEYCRTYTELMHVTDLLFHREWDPQTRRDFLERELSLGKKALNALSDLDDPYISAKVNVTYVRYLEEYWMFIEPSWEIDVLRHHFNEALRYAEEIGDQITNLVAISFRAYARHRSILKNHIVIYKKL
jgi:predicted transcriptional regulator